MLSWHLRTPHHSQKINQRMTIVLGLVDDVIMLHEFSTDSDPFGMLTYWSQLRWNCSFDVADKCKIVVNEDQDTL